MVRRIVVAWLMMTGSARAQAWPESGWGATAWTTAQGMPINFVMGLAETPDGYLWIATTRGLVRFDGVRFSMLAPEAIGATTPYVSAVLADRAGRLWTATSEGEVLARLPSGRWQAVLPRHTPRGSAHRFAADPWGGTWATFEDSTALYVAPDGRARLVAADPARGDIEHMASASDGMRLFGRRRVDLWDGSRLRAEARVPPGRWNDAQHVRASGEAFTYRAGRWAPPPPGFVPDGPSPLQHGASYEVRLDGGARWFVERGQLMHQPPGGTPRAVPSRVVSRSFAVVDSHTVVWREPGGPIVIAEGDRLHRVPLPPGVDPYLVTGALRGRDGCLWVGTDSGLIRLRRHRVAAVTPDDGLLGRLVFPVMHTRDGATWAGTFQGGITRFAPEPASAQAGGAARRLARADGLPTDNVHSLFQDRDGRIWAGTHAALAVVAPSGERVLAAQRLHLDTGILTFAYAPDGAMLAGGSAIRRVEGTPETGLALVHEAPIHTVTFALAPDGTVHAAGRDGVFRREAPGRWRRLLAAGGTFYAATVEADGTLWASGSQGTLVRRDPDGRVTTYGPEQGFTGGGAWAVAFDLHRAAWLPGDGGLRRVPRASLDRVADALHAGHAAHLDDLVTLGEADGMPSAEGASGRPAASFGPDGRLWTTTIAGLAVVDPDAFARPPRVPPVAHVEGVLADGEPVAPVFGARARLPAGTRNVILRYTATTLAVPEAARFRHRLDGADAPGWTAAGARREVHFTSLGPGRYTFRVQAAGPDGAWSPEGAAYAFVIPPLWWQSWAARLAGLLLFVGVIALAVHLREARRHGRVLARLVDERTRRLRQAQATTEVQGAEIAAQRDALARVAATRSAFFAHVAHEFGTPLTLVAGPLDELLDGRYGALAPDARRAAHLARDNARRLRRLADDLLALARADNGALPHRPSAVCAVALAEACGRAAAALAERRRVRLAWHLPERPLPLAADAEHLGRALGNVLANAVKFTPEGGSVRLRVVATEAEVVFEVRDTGPGIAPRDLPHVFERFWQAENAPDGTGLGLALAREIARRHGGEAEVESEPGFGATVRLRLPRGPLPEGSLATEFDACVCPLVAETLACEADAPDEDGANGGDAPGTRPLALVVDDHPDVRRLVARQLASRFRTAEAASADEALALARAERPAVVVTDWMMPGRDGLALLADLRADEALADVPVLVLTARTGEAAVALAAGADDVVEKPHDAHELAARAGRLVAAPRPPRSLAPEPPPDASRDAAFVLALRRAMAESLYLHTFRAADLAEAVGLSTSTLNRRLAGMGMEPAGTLLRETRLVHAADLLATGGLLVKEVAQRVGFRDVEHFGRLFRERFGVPPSEWSRSGIGL